MFNEIETRVRFALLLVGLFVLPNQGPYYELLFPVSLRRELNCLANSYYEHYCQPVSGHVTTQTDFCTTFGWLAVVYAYYELYFDVSIAMLNVKL